jgi:hypothetical protein
MELWNYLGGAKTDDEAEFADAMGFEVRLL